MQLFQTIHQDKQHREICVLFFEIALKGVPGLKVSLPLKVPIETAADDSLQYFFHCFSDKIMLDISCESGRGFT